MSNWRVLFLLSVPVALGALAASFGSLAESKAGNRSGKLDVVGVAIGTAAVATLVFGASFGSERGWASPIIIGSLRTESQAIHQGFPLGISARRP